ncbi:hypothetical protein Tco_0291768 [Tanacetum coccineum]
MQERLDLNKSQGAQTPKEVNRMKNVPYASALGSIMYAVRCTRPDVAFAQNLTSRFQQNPGELHWTAVKNILKYLRNTKDMFLVYGGNPGTELRVECYCDAGFETDREGQRAAMSATESEYIAASEAAMEAVWIRKFILSAWSLGGWLIMNPSELHWTTVKNILKYLRNTKDMFLVYGGNPSTELRVECYCDAGFETDREGQRAAMSATESEYIAASEAAMEAVWIRKFILSAWYSTNDK